MPAHGVKLKPEEREMMIERAAIMFGAGATKVDIEAELGVSMPTVRNLLSAARYRGLLPPS